MTFRLHLDFRPHSAKNRRRIVRIGSMPRLLLSREAKRDLDAIRQMAQIMVGPRSTPLYPDESCRMHVEHVIDNDSVIVTVDPIGPRPKGRTGRKSDAHGLIEIIADGLQGIVVGNDNQFADARVIRTIGGVIA